MKIGVTNKRILTGMSSKISESIRQQLTIQNPAYDKAIKMGKRPGSIPRTLKFYKDTPAGIECPKGAAKMLFYGYPNYRGKPKSIVGSSRTLQPVSFNFKRTPQPLPGMIIDALSQQSIGMLESENRADRIINALFLIAQREQPALILVHTKKLMNQWIELIGKGLEIQAADVGIIGGGKFRIGDKITVGMVQTLHKRAAEVSPHIGHLIVDECHNLPAMQSIKTIEQFDCKYLLGLTATPFRSDGLGEIFQWHVGHIYQRIVGYRSNLYQAEPDFITTNFKPVADPSNCYSQALSELTRDLGRNRLICRTVKSHNCNGITLILSERREHCETLAYILKQEQGIDANVLTGKTPANKREQILKDLQSGKCRYLVTTNQLIDKGVDLPIINTLAMATPGKFPGRLVQLIKPVLRPAPGKAKTIILDFVDDHRVFESSARSRWETYNQLDLSVLSRIEEKEERCIDSPFDEDSPFDDDIDSLFGN